KGESQDTTHKGEIDVLSWSWGMQAKPSLGGGGATGKASINELKVLKKVDSASTALMLALRTNEAIQKAVLTLRKAGKSQLEFLKTTSEKGRATILRMGGGEAGGGATRRGRVTFPSKKRGGENTPRGRAGLPGGPMPSADRWSEAK